MRNLELDACGLISQLEFLPPVLEMSQKLGLEPEALISADVPARPVAGAQSREKSVAKTTLFFMGRSFERTLPVRAHLS